MRPRRSAQSKRSSSEALQPPALPFDPLERARQVEALVMQGTAKRYYRFRFAPFYKSDIRKGIVTCDGCGCNLLCAYCWNLSRNIQPETGRFYEPHQVADKLKALSAKEQNANADLYRISGCEPFLGLASTKHLVAILDEFEVGGFVLETNGIMLGAMPALCDLLVDRDIHVRVAVKSDSPQQFERITGAEGKALKYQRLAIEELNLREISCSVAIMPQFVDPKKIAFRGSIPDQLEQEQLKKYPQIVRQLRERGIVAP